MDKKNVMKIAGVACIVIGSALLFASGVTESVSVAVVGCVFALAAAIAVILK